VVACKPRSTDAAGGPAPSGISAAAAASVFRDMHTAACAGDADAFFAHVVEATLLDNMAKRKDGGAQSLAIAKVGLDTWRKDIKEKGKQGTICGWSTVSSEKVGDTQRVEVRSKAGGKTFFLFFGDAGGEPKLVDYEYKGESLVAPTERVDMTVGVAELLKDYKSNELRGDNKYKGKRIRIIGKAGEFKRDITNTIYMTVGTGERFEIPEAQCFFGDEYADAVASLTKGATVVVNCTVGGLMMNVLMKDCTFPSVVTLNACYKLQSAGIANECMPVNEPLEETHFNTSTYAGTVVLLRDGDSYDEFVADMGATMDKDAGSKVVSKVIGSRSALIAVMLVMFPSSASADVERRAKAVVDRLEPASK